jgi:hypothetical protein
MPCGHRPVYPKYLDPFGQQEGGEADQHSNSWRQGQKEEQFGNNPEDMHECILAVT